MFFNLFFGLHSKLNRKVTVHIIVLVKYSALPTAANTTRNFPYFFNELCLFLYLKSTVLLCWSNNTYQEALDSPLALTMVCRFLHA